MSALSEKVTGEVLSLPVELRLELVEVLLKSLNVPTRPEIDALWAEEAERRIDQIDRGEAKTIPGEQVFDELRKKHRTPLTPTPPPRPSPANSGRGSSPRP